MTQVDPSIESRCLVVHGHGIGEREYHSLVSAYNTAGSREHRLELRHEDHSAIDHPLIDSHRAPRCRRMPSRRSDGQESVRGAAERGSRSCLAPRQLADTA